MTEISLPALDGRSPLGYLAALGTLRLLEFQGYPAQLAWSDRDATAVLHTADLSSADEVAQRLADLVAAIPDDSLVPGGPPGLPPPGEAPDKLRLPPAQLRRLAGQLTDAGDPAVVQVWLGSLVTDLAVDNQGRSAHTLFGAFSGKQSMYTMLSKSLALVRARPQLLREALLRWRRTDGVTGEYLDHRVLFDAADSPSGESKERGVPGATWLALMSYPLIRTTSVDGRRPISTGWYTSGQRMRLRWPLWRMPLDLPAIQALWESGLLTDVARGADLAGNTAPSQQGLVAAARLRHNRALEQLQAVGVFAVHRAERRRIPGRNFAGVLTPVAG